MTRKEYEKTYIRMMDSVRTDHKGNEDCAGVPCGICPIRHVCENWSLSFSAFEIIEIVEKWGSDHPVITYADKYEQVFGCKPLTAGDGIYLCPHFSDCPSEVTCTECKKNYWESEYIEPKRGD